ncbi:MAG TPA: TylF/MycF/NovP-related O-methyltransferase [Pseudolabrys sp.]|nr:TylF/MycF/NovP-related O-methyltransferase [Pseudolabrys sp.]
MEQSTRFDQTDGARKSVSDADIEARIQAHCEKYGIDSLTAVKNFVILTRRHALKRFLAHVEFFKMTVELPGDILELGVFRGMGLFTWANLLESYSIGDRTKIVYGFDNWRGFISLAKEDGAEIPGSGKQVGGFDASSYLAELKDAIALFDSDRFIPQKARIKLVDGDICETIPRFLADNPGVRFSLVHFDCDLYRPTKVALEGVWNRVVRGGVLLFDEYAISDWPGETRAVDEFFADKLGVTVKTLSWTNTPAGYVIKP